ncbi:MAG TPA: hypothetical protein VL400_01250 [Polyangiaceae bacterium]|nr:hypothetical protein [Polyangiaceae bacterium]
MSYREPPRLPPERDELVVVRTFSDSVEAGLARSTLASEGIHAWVTESLGYNPALSSAIGGTELKVRLSDAERAQALLDRVDRTRVSIEEDDEPEGTIRCPRCELPYCFFEKPRLASAQSSLLGVAGLVFAVFAPRRWRCHKCLHVWDDPKAGPARPTPLPEDAPRPVFRLRRPHVGMGVFAGWLAGTAGLLVVEGPAALRLMVGGMVLGGVVGSFFGSDVCSEPSCRGPLARDLTTCPKCHGGIAGRVASAPEHFAASADFRRELALTEAREAARLPKTKKKPKKKAAKPARADEA